jgi:hypothetical protein
MKSHGSFLEGKKQVSFLPIQQVLGKKKESQRHM